MAIFAIIALGVGFFTGLKASKPDMIQTGQKYVEDQKLFDYRLISTWGFTQEEVQEIQELDWVHAAEGAMWEDFLYRREDSSDGCLKAMSVTEQVNQLTVVSGRLPEKPDECVLDAHGFTEDMIGKKIIVSPENSKEIKESLSLIILSVEKGH